MSDFEQMRSELESFDQKREELILTSRKLLTLSKKAMYHTHRDEFDQAKNILDQAQPIVQELKDSLTVSAHQRVGAVTAALQEWGESAAYFVYATEQKLASKEELGLDTEDYLLALADLTGELTRRAVLASIKKDSDQVKAIRVFVDDLFGEFLSFNFRNGELRKKTDQMRWNLQKVEELLIRL